MKRPTKRICALALVFSLVVQQSGAVGALADEMAPEAETALETIIEEEAMPVALSAEPAIETAETKPPDETPEVTVIEAVPVAASAEAQETAPVSDEPEQTEALAVEAATEKVTEAATEKATEVPATESTTEAEMSADTESLTEAAAETQTEAVTENLTEAVTEAATESRIGTEPETEAVTETESESETESGSESESESETEAYALQAKVKQEVTREEADGKDVTVVRYAVEVANTAKSADAEGITMAAVLPESLSYLRKAEETDGLSCVTFAQAGEIGVFGDYAVNPDAAKLYEDDSVFFWNNQCIAAGEAKSYFFYAVVGNEKVDTEALTGLWTLDGAEVPLDQISWVNADLLSAEPEFAEPGTYEIEDKLAKISVTVPEGVKIPYGSVLTAASLKEGSKAYEAAKKAVVDANPEIAFRNHLFYDIHFELDGKEVEPEGGDVTVAISLKKALDTGAKASTGDAAVAVSHLKDDGTLEDVTDEVKLNKKDEVKSVEFATDSFSIMAISAGITDGYFTDDTLSDYSLEYLLRNFNLVSFGNVDMTLHCMGGILVKGDLSGSASGFADSEFITEESFVKGYVSFMGKCNSRNHYRPDAWAFYVGSGYADQKNEITADYNGNYTVLNGMGGFNSLPDGGCGPVLMNDDYVNWTTLYNSVDGTMDALVQKSVNTYNSDWDWSEITIPAGTNVSLNTNGHKVKIKLDGDTTATTIINVLDSGEVTMPQITGLSSREDGDSMPVAFTFPNATTVKIVSELSPSFGHVIAPDATIDIGSCNYNGCVIGGSMTISGEGHMWPYTGGSLIPASGGFSAYKTVDGKTPAAGQTFDFTLEELKDGAWTTVETKSNNGSKVEFSEILYTDAAEHWYLIFEEAGSGNYDYDASVYAIHVIVEESEGDGIKVYNVKDTEYYKVNDGVGKDDLISGGTVDVSLLVKAAGSDAVKFDNKAYTRKEVQKLWVGDTDDVRPDSIKVQLKANGKDCGPAVTLNAANGWHCAWEKLAKYDGANEIAYTVSEVGSVAGYVGSTSVTGDVTTITNTYDVKDTEMHVQKVWADDNDRDDLRPDSVMVQLYANGSAYGDVVALSGANGWHYDWTKLPEKKDGVSVSYDVKEVGTVTGYTTAYQTNGNTVTITNTHDIEKTEKSVVKVWEDDDNRDGLRPASIKVQLYADGAAYGPEVVLDEGNHWSHSWNNLPANHAGKAIAYTVNETVSVPGYDCSVSAVNGRITLTNTHEAEKTSVSVDKVWEDDGNRDALRPAFVEVQLLADGSPVGGTVALNADNGWHYGWSDLPKNEDGKAIAYTVEEISDVKGYTTAYAGEDGVFTVTNTHTIEKTEASVKKVWDDDGNEDGLRPDSVALRLLADGEPTGDTVVLDEANGWEAAVKDLPKNRNEDGQAAAIAYTWEELEVPAGYEMTGNTADGTVTTVTNTHRVGTAAYEVSKVWADALNKDGLRPDAVSVQLYANGSAYGDAVTLDEANGWHYVWSDLPERRGGAVITYTAEELSVPEGYTVSYEASEHGTVITNTHAASTEIVLMAKKAFDGTMTEGQFTFTLTEVGGDGVVSTAANKADGSVTFDKMVYTKAGTHTYEIREVIPQPKDAAIVYDTSVKTVKVTVTEEDGTLKAVSDADGMDLTFTNRLTSVKVSKTDIASGAELEGAHIRILDEDGNIVEEWVSGKSAHEVKGLLTGTSYTLRETVAPDGYTVATDTVFVLKDDGTVDAGKTTAAMKDGVLLVQDSLNRVSIRKVDEDGNALSGAKLVIKDTAGIALTEPWTSGEAPHEITGLAAGEYLLSEVQAPEGYHVAADVPFTVTGMEKAGTVIDVAMVDARIPAGDKRSIAVTKHLMLDGISTPLAAHEMTYYVALFSDAAKTQRVSDVKPMYFHDSASSTVTFDNLAAGTYYVGETDANGTLLVSKIVNDVLIFYPEYASDQVTLSGGKSETGSAEFTNIYMELPPEGFYLSGEITLTKRVLLDGETASSNDVYYARLYYDEALTDPASDVVALDLAGGTSASVTITNLFIGTKIGDSVVYYVAETDESGNPLDNAADLAFDISIENQRLVMDANNSRQEAVITNRFYTEDYDEEEEEFEDSTEYQGVVAVSENAPKTGDTTDIWRYVLLLGASACVLCVLFFRRRRKA